MVQHNAFKSLQFLASCKRCGDLPHANNFHHTERIDFTCTRLAEIRWTKNTDVLVDMFASSLDFIVVGARFVPLGMTVGFIRALCVVA